MIRNSTLMQWVESIGRFMSGVSQLSVGEARRIRAI
uniref:Uncharacterized protein n=1 Tax=Anopheles dirus TaxID=7168 RepID=A0A182NYJ7_9DIPT